jgi:hypothetical protein
MGLKKKGNKKKRFLLLKPTQNEVVAVVGQSKVSG